MSSRIGLLGSKGTTLDFLTGFEAETGHRITHLATLSDESKAAKAVAFRRGGDLLAAAEGLVVHQVRSYPLREPGDVAFFREADLDVLFVIGWERLLPDEVLNLVRRGAYGMHGSPYGLPRGRGRSPMNWAILQGHKTFITSLFRYTPGMDDGDIVGSRVFTIGERDDIGVLHLKNRLSMMTLARRHLPEILAGSAHYIAQPDEVPSFYPKRTPDDGAINWADTTQAIDRLVRAVAPPYPGAFCELGGARLTIEAAQPFEDAFFESSIAPGTIVDVSPSMRMIVVKTGDGALLVTRYSGAEIGPAERGRRLDSQSSQWTEAVLAERYGPSVPPAQWEVKPKA